MIRRYNENKKNHIKHCSEFVVAFNSCSCKNIRIQITTVFSTGYYGRHNRRCINNKKPSFFSYSICFFKDLF